MCDARPMVISATPGDASAPRDRDLHQLTSEDLGYAGYRVAGAGTGAGPGVYRVPGCPAGATGVGRGS